MVIPHEATPVPDGVSNDVGLVSLAGDADPLITPHSPASFFLGDTAGVGIDAAVVFTFTLSGGMSLVPG